mgnify:CR=1 FL=1
MKLRKISVNVALLLLGSLIQAFGLYNIHSLADVTEGGVLGATLLLQHWFDISPAVSGFLMNAACYIFGFCVLGKQFVFYSAVAGLGFSGLYAVLEQFPPIYPRIAEYPLLAAILGALFIGVGAGICVRANGAACGDDALAMGFSKLTKLDIKWIYLFTDLTVILLSISYIPLSRLVYSLLTVVLSGQIISLIQKIKPRKAHIQKC